MQNCTVKVDTGSDGKPKALAVVIDLTKRLGRSASGKSILVASTGGGTAVEGCPEGFKLNLSAWVKGE